MHGQRNIQDSILYAKLGAPIPMAVRSKAWVWVHSNAGNVGSNPAGDMDICLL